MKRTRSLAIVIMALVFATAGLADQGGPNRSGCGPFIDTSQLVVFEGTVVQLVAGLGHWMPELEMTTYAGEDLSFILGPYWFLQASGFAAEAGDAVEVSAYTCSTCESDYAVAKVVNVTKGHTLLLRAEDGTPLWSQSAMEKNSGSNMLGRHLGRAGSGGSGSKGNGSGSGSTAGNDGQGKTGTGAPGSRTGQGGNCDVCATPDLGQVQTFVGTVSAVDAQAGDGTPTLTLATSAGDVTFLISPYSVLLRAGFAITVDQMLEITAAPVEYDSVESWLALVVKDTETGLIVVLRDPSTGLPPAGRGRR